MTPGDHVWWLISRSSGIVAFALCAASVLLGLAMAAKAVRHRPAMGKQLLAIHEHTALAGLVSIGVHGIALLGDGWIRASPADLAVPFLIDFKPAAVAAGIVAGWLAAALGLSFYVRKRLGTKRWRAAHRAAILVYALSLVHALTAGTDAATPWFRGLAAATAVPIAWLMITRLLPRPALAAPMHREPAHRAGRPG